MTPPANNAQPPPAYIPAPGEKPENHLILGGGGFIGRHVALFLARAGHRVKIVDREPPRFNFPPVLADRIEWEVQNLGQADWDRVIEGDYIIHHYAWSSVPASANNDPLGDLQTNVGQTLRLLDALKRKGYGRLIFASSGGTVYGILDSIPVTENHSLAPISAYGISKAAAEFYLTLYRKLHGVDCRIARISNPYGAGQDISRGFGAVNTFLHHALTGQKITIWGDGSIVRDYIHISDVAACLAAIACAPYAEAADFIFNVGSGKGTSLNEIIAALEQHLGRRLDVSRTEHRDFDVPVSVLSIDRAQRALAWVPQLSFSAGIARTLRDLQAGVVFSSLN